jgi:outer membrane lipoprotein LolB
MPLSKFLRRLSPILNRAPALAACAAAGLILAGCAAPRMPSASNTATSLNVQTTHAYAGRFAVQYTDSNGQPRNAYGNFQWHETGDTVTLQLLNPLGQTLAIVEAAPSSATLELPNHAPQTAPNVEDLMHAALGFALPVSGLRYWLQPSAAPSSRARTKLDPQSGRLQQIQQDGWTIDYLAYAAAPATGVKRLNLARQNPALQVKLVLDQ